jgi:predicted dehydrogenase
MAEHHVLIIGNGPAAGRHLRALAGTARARLSTCGTGPCGTGLQPADQGTGISPAISPNHPAALARHYDDLSQALADASAGITAAVVVCTARQRVPTAKLLADAGIHMLIEAPLSTTLEEIEALQGVVARRRLLAMVAYPMRLHPALQAARSLLAAGRYGRPLQIVAALGPSMLLAGKEVPGAGGPPEAGVIETVLSHAVNAGEWLVGPVERVLADAGRPGGGSAFENVAHVLARHGPVLGSYSANLLQPLSADTIHVVCEQGTIGVDLTAGVCRSLPEGAGEWRIEAAAPLTPDDLLAAQTRLFLDAIEGEADPHCTLTEAVQSLRVNLAVAVAAEQPRWLPVRPDAWRDQTRSPWA